MESRLDECDSAIAREAYDKQRKVITYHVWYTVFQHVMLWDVFQPLRGWVYEELRARV
jgi:hypothetical protein